MKNDEEGKVLIHILKVVVALIIYLLVIPAVIVFLSYYLKLVLLGEMHFKEFLDSFRDYSYRPVVDFYINVRHEIEGFINRLKA